MSKTKWINLHCHTEYSNFDGSIKIDDLVDYSAKQGLNAVAVTDHGMMCGITALYNKTKNMDIKPIYGCELYSDSLLEERQDRTIYHLLALAKNKEGYHNLLKLLSMAHKGNFKYKARVNLDMLKRYGKGIVFSTACIAGELAEYIRRKDFSKAVEFMNVLTSVGDSAYVEMTDVGPVQAEFNDELYKFAVENGFKPLLTLDSHYLPKDAAWHPYMLAAGMKKSYRELKAEDRTLEDYDLSLRKSDDIEAKWGKKYPEAIENAGIIADSIERFEIFSDRFLLPEQKKKENELEIRSRKGLEARLDVVQGHTDRKAYFDRLDMELGVITRMGFEDYFLMLSNVIGWARSQGIAVGPGRGSGAGSIVAWSLGITQIDPIRFGLIFERFLNPDRKTMPDIDVDFEDKRRHEVVEYIKKTYSEDSVCGIISYSRPKLRGAIKDACRVFGVSVGLGEPGDRLSRVIGSWCDKAEEDKLSPEEIETGLNGLSLPDELTYLIPAKTRRAIFRLAIKLTGVLRHFGRHAAGLIVAPGHVTDHTPLANVKGELVSQFDMSGVETAKLIKFDLLGLQTMSMLTKCIELAGRAFPDRTIPSLNDLYDVFNKNKGALRYGDESKGISNKSLEKSLALLAGGDSTGVFQLESVGMKRLLCQVKPQSMEDLSCQLALFRPGPIESGMVDAYVDACSDKQNDEHRPFPLEVNDRTSAICQDSKGVCIYQEQVMKIVSEIAGYTAAEADVLRRAMGKKKADVMEREKAPFIARAGALGVSGEAASETFEALAKFSGYGFNKSHSMAYAFLAMSAAWFKTNYPAPFWAAFLEMKYLNSKKDDLYPHFREYAETSGHRIMFPDICDGISEETLGIRVWKKRDGTCPSGDYHKALCDDVDGGTVMLGLEALNGLGRKQIDAIKDFPFSDGLDDLIHNAVYENTLSPKKFCTLLFSGALDRAIERQWGDIGTGPHIRGLFMVLNGEWQKRRGEDDITRMIGSFYDTFDETYAYRRPGKDENGNVKTPYYLSRERMRAFPAGEVCLLVEDLSRAIKRKRDPWDEDRVKAKIDLFISNLGTTLKALNRRHGEYRDDGAYLTAYESSIYCSEKESYGDVLSLDPLKVAAHAVDDRFDFYAGESGRIRNADRGESVWILGVLNGIVTSGKTGETMGIVSGRQTDRKLFVNLDYLNSENRDRRVRMLKTNLGEFISIKCRLSDRFPYCNAEEIKVVPVTGEIFDTGCPRIYKDINIIDKEPSI